MEFKHFVLVAVYVPNAGEGLKRHDYRINEWDFDFHNYLASLEEEMGKPVILAGDLNVAHHEIDVYDPRGKEKVPGYTPEERQSFTDFLSRGFVDSYRLLYPARIQYSFWSMRQNLRPSNRGWRLDYFVLSSNYESKYGVELVDAIIDDPQKGSDHCPVALKLKVPVDGEAEERSKPFANSVLKTVGDIPDDTKGDPEEAKSESPKQGTADTTATGKASAESKTLKALPEVSAISGDEAVKEEQKAGKKRAKSTRGRRPKTEDTIEEPPVEAENEQVSTPPKKKKTFLRRGKSAASRR